MVRGEVRKRVVCWGRGMLSVLLLQHGLLPVMAVAAAATCCCSCRRGRRRPLLLLVGVMVLGFILWLLGLGHGLRWGRIQGLHYRGRVSTRGLVWSLVLRRVRVGLVHRGRRGRGGQCDDLRRCGGRRMVMVIGWELLMMVLMVAKLRCFLVRSWSRDGGSDGDYSRCSLARLLRLLQLVLPHHRRRWRSGSCSSRSSPCCGVGRRRVAAASVDAAGRAAGGGVLAAEGGHASLYYTGCCSNLLLRRGDGDLPRSEGGRRRGRVPRPPCG